MKTTIKLLGLGAIALFGFFAGAQIVSAQSVVTTCTSATFNGSVTPNGYATTVWFEWGTSASLGNKTSSQIFGATVTNSTFSQLVSVLKGGTTYYYRAMAQNTMGTATGTTISFNTPLCASKPTATTNSATGITATSAILKGTANGNGSDTETWFQWGTTSSFGNTTTAVAQGTGSANLSEGVSDLIQGTTYYYRAVAQNAQGVVYGTTVSFKTATPSSVITNVASNIKLTSAVLNGYLNQNGTTGNVTWFEWGTTTSFGNATTYVPQGSFTTTFNAALTGLAANTMYYFRASSQNSQGIVQGETLSFTTATLPVVETLPPGVITGLAS